MTKLERLDRRIKNIELRLEKEKRNLIDSGHDESSNSFGELYFEIVKSYEAQLVPLIVARHRMSPYKGEEKKKFTEICGHHDIHPDFLPLGDDWKEALAELKHKAYPKKGKK